MKLSSCCFKLSRKLPYLSRLSIFGALHRYITAYVGPSNAPCPDDLAFSSTGDDISAGYEIVLYRKTESSLETVKIFLSTGSSSFQIRQLETGYYRLINNLFKSYFPLSLSLCYSFFSTLMFSSGKSSAHLYTQLTIKVAIALNIHRYLLMDDSP